MFWHSHYFEDVTSQLPICLRYLINECLFELCLCLRRIVFFQEKVCFSDQSSHRDTWSHSKMTSLAWITCTLGGLGVSVDQRECCLDRLGNHLRPPITLQQHRHNSFKRGLIAVFKELFTIFSDLQSPWIISRETTTGSFLISPGNWFTPRKKVDCH